MRTKQRNQKRCPSVPSNLYNRNIKTLLVGFTPFCESLELSSTKTQSFSQGFGCYVLNEQMINKPLEEMMDLASLSSLPAVELWGSSPDEIGTTRTLMKRQITSGLLIKFLCGYLTIKRKNGIGGLIQTCSKA
ncbi:hypothetical protein DITRI_Ditri14bG0066000 [Diplodiscus trichospermus]